MPEPVRSGRDGATHGVQRRVAPARQIDRRCHARAGAGRQGQRLRVRPAAPRRRSRPSSPTRSRSAPCTSSTGCPTVRTPVVLTPTLDAPEDTQPDPHRRIARARRRAQRVARPRHRQARVVDAPVRRRHRTRREGSVRPDSRSKACRSIRHSPVTTVNTEPRSNAGWTSVDPSLEVWVSHLSPSEYALLPTSHRYRLRLGTALWHGDKSALRLEASVLHTTTIAAGERAGYRLGTARARRNARDHRGGHRQRRAPARRRAQSVPPRTSTAGVDRAAAHAHVDGVRAGRRPVPDDRGHGSTCSGRSRPRWSTRLDGSDQSATWPRRRPRSRPDRCGRDELPRIPHPARRAPRRRLGTRPVRSVDGPALDAVRGHVRARRRRRRHVADPLGDRRRGAHSHDALATRQARPAPVRGRRVLRLHLGRHDPAVLRRDVRPRRVDVHPSDPLARRDRRGRRARRLVDPLVGVRTGPRRPHHEVADVARRDCRPTGSCSTCSSTAPTRCCRGWRSSARGSCSAASSTTTWWRAAAIGGGFALFTIANLVNASASGERALVLTSTDPFDRGLVYVMSALGTALIAFAAISWLADRFTDAPLVDALRRAGQMSLTLYIAHALVFNLVVDWLDWIRPTGLDTALLFSAGLLDRRNRRRRRVAASLRARPGRGGLPAAHCVTLRCVIAARRLDQSELRERGRRSPGRRSRTPGGTTRRVAPTSRASTSRDRRCPCVCCWIRSSPTAAAAFSASSTSCGLSNWPGRRTHRPPRRRRGSRPAVRARPSTRWRGRDRSAGPAASGR